MAERIHQAVRGAYGRIARGDGGCGCGAGEKDVRNLSLASGYTGRQLDEAPAQANLGLSCGNPTAVAGLKPGETVLDLGSGAGFDCFLASSKVGADGKVIGVDMTAEMIQRAQTIAGQQAIKNVEFRLGEVENLPVADESVDVRDQSQRQK